MTRRRLLLCTFLLLAAAGGVAWYERGELESRYFIYRLMHVDDPDAEGWAADAGRWGDAVEGALLEELTAGDEARCRRAESALAHLYAGRSAADTIGVLAQWSDRFGDNGRAWAVNFVADNCHELPRAVVAPLHKLIDIGLRHSQAATRRQAVRLAEHFESDHLERLAPFVNDADADVRRSVVLALGTNRQALGDEDLLPRLHDVSAEIRRLARLALQSRGLTDQQIRLGQLLTDPEPAKRLKLIALLYQDSELDLSLWLRRLSQDPVPAVRVAAIRAAAELHVFQLAGRVAEAANRDPEPSVRPLAAFFLRQFQGVQPVGFESSKSP